MMRTGRVPAPPRTVAYPLPQLRRRTRSVQVTVISGGREVDSFQVTTPLRLCSALRPIYAHLRGKDASVRFRGIEREQLPLGVGSVCREVDLPSLGDALAFLAA